MNKSTTFPQARLRALPMTLTAFALLPMLLAAGQAAAALQSPVAQQPNRTRSLAW